MNAQTVLYAMWSTTVYARAQVLKLLGSVHTLVTHERYNPRRRLEPEFLVRSVVVPFVSTDVNDKGAHTRHAVSSVHT